jgi:hypothetical protein
MFIARGRVAEKGQAHPADVCLAHPASHMVATIRLLDGRAAFRTVFDVMFPFKPLKCLSFAGLQVFGLRACDATVRDVAGRADDGQAFWARV